MKAPAKINLALVVGPRRAGRKARGRHRAPASRPRRRDLARGRARPVGRGIRGGHARPRGAHSTRRGGRRRGALAGRDRQADPSRSGARRWKLRRRHGSSPGQRDASANRLPQNACTSSPPAWAPTSRSSSRTARSSGPATARTSARSTSRATTTSCSFFRAAPRRSRPRRSTTISTAKTGSRTGATALLAALEAPRPGRPSGERPRLVASCCRAPRRGRLQSGRLGSRADGLRALRGDRPSRVRA